MLNIFQISFKNIKSKPLNAALSIILFAAGIFIISFLLQVKDQLTSHMQKNVAGINLVVGAKGSPIQLILSSIYHVDYPTGNISYEEANRLGKNPLVAQAVPLALGDNYQGYRIVGTTSDYADIYEGKVQEGVLWKEDFEVTIGAKIARNTGLKPGDHFTGIHGFIETDHSHEEHPYTVTGIFHPTGSVLDQLILTNISSVWRVHDHGEDHHEAAEHNDDHLHEAALSPTDEAGKEITALLVFFRNAMGAITLPRHINQNTNMQAASPAMELNRLYSLMGTGVQTISLIAYLIIVISALSIFISLLNAMKERKYELALIRVLGGNKKQVFFLVITEGLMIVMAGFVAGIILSRLVTWGISAYTEDAFHYGLNLWKNIHNDLLLLLFSLIIGFSASILPALKAMKTDLSKTLSE